MTKEKLTIEAPAGVRDDYPCSSCKRETDQTILARVATADEVFEGDGRILFWDEYLTTKCNGCGTIGFCHQLVAGFLCERICLQGAPMLGFAVQC